MCSLSRAVFSMSKNMLRQRELCKQRENEYAWSWQRNNTTTSIERAHVSLKHSTAEKEENSFADLLDLAYADLDSFTSLSGLKQFLFGLLSKHFQFIIKHFN